MTLYEDERIDDLNIKGYRIIQNQKKFCFGMDAVLLSSFAKVKRGENVLDLGTGTGIIPILLEAKTEGKQFTGGVTLQKCKLRLSFCKVNRCSASAFCCILLSTN